MSAFRSVDLPVFVYPASATTGVSARRRALRCVSRRRSSSLSRRLSWPIAASCEPAVRLELRLAGAARPDAAAEALEVLPHAAHPGEVVLELCQLDLELAFGARRVLGEDVEDELGAVDHAQLELVLETALLARVEVVVDDEGFGVRAGDRLLQLDELPLPHVGARIRRGPALQELPDGLHARGAQKLPHLGELVLFVNALGQHGDEEAALRLGPGRGIRLVVGHTRIMPPPRRGAKSRSSRPPPRAARRRRSARCGRSPPRSARTMGPARPRRPPPRGRAR